MTDDREEVAAGWIHALPPQHPHTCREVGVVRGDRATFARREDLVAVEREGADGPERTDWLSPVPCVVRLRRVLDDRHAAPSRDLVDRVHVCRMAVEMDGN